MGAGGKVNARGRPGLALGANWMPARLPCESGACLFEFWQKPERLSDFIRPGSDLPEPCCVSASSLAFCPQSGTLSWKCYKAWEL